MIEMNVEEVVKKLEKEGRGRDSLRRETVVVLSVLRNVACMAAIHALVLFSAIFPYGRNVVYGYRMFL